MAHQAVGTHDELVAVFPVEDPDLRVQAALLADRLVNDVGHRMDPRILFGHHALADPFLHQRMVLSEAFDPVPADAVHAAVAGMRDHDLFMKQRERGDRGAHGRGERALIGVDAVQRPVDVLQGVMEKRNGLARVGRLPLAETFPLRQQPLRRELAGQFAAAVSTDAVGHEEQRTAGPGIHEGAETVLVVIALESGMGLAGDAGGRSREKLDDLCLRRRIRNCFVLFAG